MSLSKWVAILVLNITHFCTFATAAGELPLSEVEYVAELFSTSQGEILEIGASQNWAADYRRDVPSWLQMRDNMLDQKREHYAPGNEPPYIMMAGYMDTDVTWEDGGTFKMLAWVWDADNDIESVELYYDGKATGVFLWDDGLNGDFNAADNIYGLVFDIAPYTLPVGEYILELKARDIMGNESDLWPYLTIHP